MAWFRLRIQPMTQNCSLIRPLKQLSRKDPKPILPPSVVSLHRALVTFLTGYICSTKNQSSRCHSRTNCHGSPCCRCWNSISLCRKFPHAKKDISWSVAYRTQQTVVTVTVTGTNPAATGAPAVTLDVGDSTPAPSATPATPANGNIGDFGKCSVPEIEFGVGFDNRKETSFQPVDKGEILLLFSHPCASDLP